MSIQWMEILLQGFFFDDCDSYTILEEDFQELYQYIKSYGMIDKKKVVMQVDIAFEKMMISSVGKCESIKVIVNHEYQNMQKNLKLLILTDYIKQDILDINYIKEHTGITGLFIASHKVMNSN